MLGASRARIIGQIFVETLLLSLIATGVGLIAIDIAVARRASRFPLPFWFDPSITPAVALKAIGLLVICAVVAGVLPALRATGGMLQPTLQAAGAGRSTLRRTSGGRSDRHRGGSRDCGVVRRRHGVAALPTEP